MSDTDVPSSAYPSPTLGSATHADPSSPKGTMMSPLPPAVTARSGGAYSTSGGVAGGGRQPQPPTSLRRRGGGGGAAPTNGADDAVSDVPSEHHPYRHDGAHDMMMGSFADPLSGAEGGDGHRMAGGDGGLMSFAGPSNANRRETLLAAARKDAPDSVIFHVLSRLGKVSFELLAKEVQWEARFEEDYGELREFLNSYKVLFSVNPATSEVYLRRSRRPKGPTKDMLPLVPEYHSCAYTSVCEQFHLDVLEGIYKRRGLATTLEDGVLVVAFGNEFEMFLFANGAVVWWGANREDHWIVEDDFVCETLSDLTATAVVNRHRLEDVNALFPKWSTYRVDSHMDMVPGADNTEVFAHFRERLELDHFRIPANSKRFPTAETESKMAISFAMAAASKADFFEHITIETGNRIGTMTSETGLVEHLIGSKRLVEPWILEGELRNARLMMAFITDEPDFLWEKPYLKEFVTTTMDLFSVEGRREFFNDKCDAQFELIDSITERRHRIFMMRSDFFLIVILTLDVFFLLFRLTLKMYLKGSVYYKEEEFF